jgi:hypothetical protein
MWEPISVRLHLAITEFTSLDNQTTLGSGDPRLPPNPLVVEM